MAASGKGGSWMPSTAAVPGSISRTGCQGLCSDCRGSRDRESVTTWGATTRQVLSLREHLIEQKVTLVVMEATSDYWKPFYYLLEDGLEVILVNARHVKNMPGRKTDVSDAAWLAQLGAHGLVRASFVPPEPIRRLRDLTRTRTTLTRDRAREIQRVEKLLEDAGIKLSSVASDIIGVSGRAMLEALIHGQRDPTVLAEFAKRRLRRKIPELTEALTGRFNEHHAFLARMHLDLIDRHTQAITDLTARIEEAMTPFRSIQDLIITIPGVGTTTADVIIAETGGDMTRFPTAGHLASWAGRCPGITSLLAASNPPAPGPVTPTSKEPWGRRPWPRAKNTAPTWPPSTGGSRQGGAPSKPPSPLNTPCSLPSGTCHHQ